MAEEPAPTKPKRNPKVMTLVIVLVVALVEGGAFLGVIKFFGGGPSVTYGEEGDHVLEGEDLEVDGGMIEIALLQSFKVPNNKTGHTIVYDFDISVTVPESRKEEMEELAKNRDSEIRDRIAQLIRQARPQVLQEDDFGTLRMLLKRTFSEIIGDEEMIMRVLIPRCMPIPTGG